ncbi:MAG: KH domain-containing protein [Bacilli bacterium]|nr:KH domain-containing protein [Bacilli bacterium]
MKIYNYEGKDIEEIKERVCSELKKEEEQLIILEKEVTGGLFKTKKYELKVLIIEEIIAYIKQQLNKILKLMNIDFNVEVKERDKSINFLIYSDNNSILIGKNGRTITALQIILKQSVYSRTGIYINLTLDVGDYRSKQLKNITRIAKQTAREVAKTKIEVKLDNMNSYERRMVHSLLSDNKNVYTKSEGEEPNRYVIIKPRED